MKTIGLVGGISWVSTLDYYRYLNEGVNERLGGLEFARLIIHSLNYADIKRNNDRNAWHETRDLIVTACRQMEQAGAGALLLCANTMHMIAEEVQAAVGIPLIHIAAVTADAIREKGITKVALLGTRFTMEQDFFRSRLTAAGIQALIPGEADRAFIHETIADELGKGIIRPGTKRRYRDISEALIAEGAEGVILGCTEIPLLIKPGDLAVPVFDTTYIHAMAAVRFALS